MRGGLCASLCVVCVCVCVCVRACVYMTVFMFICVFCIDSTWEYGPIHTILCVDKRKGQNCTHIRRIA